MRRFRRNIIILMVSKMVAPYIMLFAFYVIFHGHLSPGGGFQGGTLLSAAILLMRLTAGIKLGERQFKRILGTPLGSLGVLIYFGVGFLALLWGGEFLNYAYLPFGLTPEKLRYLGILLVEIGVGIAVAAILVSIYDDLLEHNNE